MALLARRHKEEETEELDLRKEMGLDGTPESTINVGNAMPLGWEQQRTDELEAAVKDMVSIATQTYGHQAAPVSTLPGAKVFSAAHIPGSRPLDCGTCQIVARAQQVGVGNGGPQTRLDDPHKHDRERQEASE